MYKLIATDLDETLLNDKHQVGIANYQAIQKATAKGVRIVPATGRGFMAVQNILAELDLKDKPNEYVLSFNGAVLTENKDNNIIYFEGISFEKAKELFEFGLTKDVCIRVQTATDIYAYNLNDNERQRFATKAQPLLNVQSQR